MKTTTTRDAKLASARSKGTMSDATKAERAALTRAIRRAGKAECRAAARDAG